MPSAPCTPADTNPPRAHGRRSFPAAQREIYQTDRPANCAPGPTAAGHPSHFSDTSVGPGPFAPKAEVVGVGFAHRPPRLRFQHTIGNAIAFGVGNCLFL